jgi:hypothetical protein
MVEAWASYLFRISGTCGTGTMVVTTFSAVFGLATLFLLNKKNIADYTTLAYLTNIALVLQPNYDKSVSI